VAENSVIKRGRLMSTATFSPLRVRWSNPVCDLFLKSAILGLNLESQFTDEAHWCQMAFNGRLAMITGSGRPGPGPGQRSNLGLSRACLSFSGRLSFLHVSLSQRSHDRGGISLLAVTKPAGTLSRRRKLQL
jgi:hypothetical protein